MRTTSETLARARQLQQAGDLRGAEQTYREVLQADPRQAEAWRRLAGLCQSQGRLDEAAVHYHHALGVEPGDAATHNSLGIVLARQGRHAAAEACFRQALELKPEYSRALNNLGISLAEQGRPEEAARCYEQALALGPKEAGILVNLAIARARLGRVTEAAEACAEALRLQPDCVEASQNLAELLAAGGRPAEAADAYREVVRLRPQVAEVHQRLGELLAAQGKLAEAAAAYEQAARLRPDDPAAQARLGGILLRLGRFAAGAEAYQRAVQLRPGDADCHLQLGEAYAGQGKLDAAVAAFQHVLELQPRSPRAFHCLGAALLEQGKLGPARSSFEKALELRPNAADAHSSLLVCLNYDPRVSPDALFAEHRRWEARHGPRAQSPPAHANDRTPARRLRVGYVSPDLRGHPVGRFLLPILSHHDRGQVEVYCYADVTAPDALTARMQSLADTFRLTRHLSDEQLARQVREDAIDVLVDLAGHTAGNRLRAFALKPAPVQVTYLGYPNTTGLRAIDYRLTDEIADPPGEPVRHTEELVRLSGGFCCWSPRDDAPPVGPLPADARGHVTFGSLHLPAKLNPMVLDHWAAVLRSVPQSRLLLFRNSLTGTVREGLRQQFAARGVAEDRLEMQHVLPPGQGYLAVYHQVDVALDTFPWNGHTTACEALWMGVPVVTRLGDRHAGRMVASVLQRVGLGHLTTQTPREYVACAVELANDRDRLRQLRADLRDWVRSSPLCDGAAFTRNLEAAYREMWRKWCER